MTETETVYQVMGTQNSYSEPMATGFVFSQLADAERMVDRLTRYRDPGKDENPKDPYTYWIDTYEVDDCLHILDMPMDRCLFFVWFTPDGIKVYAEPSSTKMHHVQVWDDPRKHGLYIRVYVWADSHQSAIDKAQEFYAWMKHYREAWV